MKQKTLLFWSGGKKSALALHQLKQNDQIEVIGLVTLFDSQKNTVPLHGIPDALITEQAKLLKLPLQRIYISENDQLDTQTARIAKILQIYVKTGIGQIAFGHLQADQNSDFYRNLIQSLGLTALFPLMDKSSLEVMTNFFDSGHKALVTSIDTRKLDNSFLSCEYNLDYLKRLPSGIDPAGAQGEFHTFVVFGPNFKTRVSYSKSIAIHEGDYLVSLVKEP